MAKDVKKTQKKNIKDEKEKKIVVEEKIETKEVSKNEVKKIKKNKVEFASIGKKVDENRKVILFCIIGFLVATLLFRCILWPDRIATLKDGTQPVAYINGEPYTANQLYDYMKSKQDVSVLLNEIDGIILAEKYPEDEDMTTKVNETVDYYFPAYEANYGYTKEQFLNYYLDVIKVDYRREKYYEDYVNGLVTEEEISKYYNDEVYGDVDSKHILVKVSNESSDGLSDADAKKLAKEIIKKLDSGKTWDEVVTEYKDKIVAQELGYNAFNADFQESYLKESKNLEVGKYSKTPVKTSYGYHIVFKIAQKDTPKLEEVKDDIIEVLAKKKKAADTNLFDKALIQMREDAKLEFADTVFGDAYKSLVSKVK